MRENNDLGIFDFDDFAMEMTSTELFLVNGGACGGGFSGGSSSVSSSCDGTSKNDVGRNYILGTPTDEQKNQNFYSISKIETYTIK